MREIKFRGYSNIQMLGSQWIYGNLYINYDDKLAYIDDQPVYFESVGQYTGLKDKHGKEIYEGDVVSDQYANFYTPIFRNGIYMAYNVQYLHLDDIEPSTQFNLVWKNGCEVIGNIYENPELLEEL